MDIADLVLEAARLALSTSDADRDSLRRSLIAILEAWGAEPLAFKKARNLLCHRQGTEHRPRATIIDTHGLDRSLPIILRDLLALDAAGSVLIMHNAYRRLRRDLEKIDRQRTASLIKPYRMEDLFHAVARLIANDDMG